MSLFGHGIFPLMNCVFTTARHEEAKDLSSITKYVNTTKGGGHI